LAQGRSGSGGLPASSAAAAMAGLTFGNSRLGQRVIGNKIDSNRYEIPEGWADTGTVTTVVDPSEESCSLLLVLQPDRSLNLKPANCSVHTYVRDFKKTEELVGILKEKSAGDLEDLMDLGRKMAKSHVDRFSGFGRLPGKQALLMFGGDALEAADFGSKDTKWAERHIRFVSGLYGLLRPYDDVKPVRDLPMGAKLKTDRGSSVTGFWTEGVTRMLAKDIEELKSGKVLLVVNTSEEYWKAVMERNLPKCTKIVRISFEGANDENTRKGRVLISRHIVHKRIDSVQGLMDFTDDGWAYDKTRSRDSFLVFNWDGDDSGAAKRPKKEKKSAEEAGDPRNAPGYHSDFSD